MKNWPAFIPSSLSSIDNADVFESMINTEKHRMIPCYKLNFDFMVFKVVNVCWYIQIPHGLRPIWFNSSHSSF